MGGVSIMFRPILTLGEVELFGLFEQELDADLFTQTQRSHVHCKHSVNHSLNIAACRYYTIQTLLFVTNYRRRLHTNVREYVGLFYVCFRFQKKRDFLRFFFEMRYQKIVNKSHENNLLSLLNDYRNFFGLKTPECCEYL